MYSQAPDYSIYQWSFWWNEMKQHNTNLNRWFDIRYTDKLEFYDNYSQQWYTYQHLNKYNPKCDSKKINDAFKSFLFDKCDDMMLNKTLTDPINN